MSKPSLAVSDIPKPWRSAWALILFIAVIAAGSLISYFFVERRIEEKVDAAAELAVTKRWTEHYQAEALKACTSAADQGAYRAVSEAMQQVVLPLQRRVDEHIAKDDERHRPLERLEDRVRVLERKVR